MPLCITQQPNVTDLEIQLLKYDTVKLQHYGNTYVLNGNVNDVTAGKCYCGLSTETDYR